MENKIRSVRLWHVTPVDLGIDFYDPTLSSLEADSELYALLNSDTSTPDRRQYSKSDFAAVCAMRAFLSSVREKLSERGELFPEAELSAECPGVAHCIAKFSLTKSIRCYIMINGTAVFYERGEPIPFSDESYFSIPVFYERQVIEDDFCGNPEVTERKKVIYDFYELMRSCLAARKRSFTSSKAFRNNGISYTLCITAIDIPGFLSTEVPDSLRRNIRALVDTSAFNNVLNRGQWAQIRKRIDCDTTDDLTLSHMSENLVMADNWSGVVVAGDLDKNNTCIKWLVEFEIFLQSMWHLFDAYGESIKRQSYTSIELQTMMNTVEHYKVQLANDISSNMEQSRMKMRQSLIETSDIRTIFRSMRGTLENKLKLNILYEDRKKGRFAFLSDVTLLIIAVMQIYGVINSLLTAQSFSSADFMSIGITAGIAAVCIWIMAKGRFS